jgi:hypothetical protein
MARRKPSDTIVELEKGMTPKQVKLARALAAGGIPKVEAYRQVYGWKGKSANALQVAATKACQNDKVSILATSLRETESARLWEDKDRFRNWIMKGITDTAANTESDITRLKALELAGKTRFASVFEEPQANEANAAVAGSLIDLIGARLQSLLGVAAPNLSDANVVDATFNPMPSTDTVDPDTPTGGGEGE